MPSPSSVYRVQLGPSVISPGLRERVLDQLSMHFQLLVQTGILAAKVGLAVLRVLRTVGFWLDSTMLVVFDSIFEANSPKYMLNGRFVPPMFLYVIEAGPMPLSREHRPLECSRSFVIAPVCLLFSGSPPLPAHALVPSRMRA